jgi:hypothetical protein
MVLEGPLYHGLLFNVKPVLTLDLYCFMHKVPSKLTGRHGGSQFLLVSETARR